LTEITSRKATSVWFVAYLLIAGTAIFALHLASNASDETPGHAGFILLAGLVAGVAATVVSLAVAVRTLGAKAVILSLAMGVSTGLLAFSVADWATQLAEFPPGKTVEYTQYFPIDRAYVSHGKGTRYHIQTSEPFDDFTLSEDDYGALFGHSEEVQPRDLCLRAQVQRNGSAMRIMLPGDRTIPSGGVVRCPADASAAH
jgi:hypothetical protein